ncbi:MAG: chorismate mutase [Parvibaculales bacterium]
MSNGRTEMTLDLAKLRDDIDAVDTQLLELLAARARLVEQVALAKKEMPQSHILRPAREAQQMRKFLQWYQETNSQIPLAGFQAIWREIISSSVSQQEPLQVFYHDVAVSIVQSQFGQAADYVFCETSPMILDKIQANPQSIGVFGKADASWLQRLYDLYCQPSVDAPFLFLTLPLMLPMPEYFCVGHVQPEPSGADCTLMIGPDEKPLPNAEVLLRHDGICLAKLSGFVTQEEHQEAADGFYICGSFALLEAK